MSAINARAIQTSAEIISNKKIGAYHHMVFAVDSIGATARPGNFVAISVGGPSSSMILRRAFAIYRASDKGSAGGHIELVVAPHGQGSKWLTSLPLHEKVDMVGPLGTSFGIPTQPARTILVGGGYGSAPLFGLAEILKTRGCRVDMVLGASSAGKIYAPLDGKRSVTSMTITTDDGSAGLHGRVSDALPKLIEENDSEIIYSCGPMAMLEAIQSIADRYGLVHQASVEESMACGIGVCMTCVVPLRGDDGIVRMSRTCIDGPVMDGSSVVWNSKGIIPEGTWGL
ncbi:MAG: dihydroorotate dehydrogenase electron transfer subunit [Actinomycetes bacterium]